MLAQLGTPPVLLRLAIVLLTAVGVTVLIERTGPPCPYRIGEVCGHDLRVRRAFDLINQPQTEQLREEQWLRPGVAYVEEAPYVPPVLERYPVGLPLVKRGQPITEAQFALLREENRAYVHGITTPEHWARGFALLMANALLAAVIVLYAARFQPALCRSLPKVVTVCALVAATLGLGLWLSRSPWHAVLVPMVGTALILSLVYNPPFALLMSVSLALVMSLTLNTGLDHLLILMAALATAVLSVRRVSTRTRLIGVAAGAGLACAAMTVAVYLLSGQTGKMIAQDAGRHFFWCLLAGFLLSGSLPVVERAFGMVTDVTLLELADGSHPLLQELVRRAPGTYTHSMTVATLAEGAAESIGADVLLTRVGSYFHDVGKMLKPQYFIENQVGPNRHDLLEPALSTLVIMGHVKDGVALAEQYGLPRPVIDFIRTHHGTTLVEYFYREAVRLQETNGHGTGELEFAFRYPGPKPRTRETGILMLADCVESASRALSAPTPSSLSKLVHDLLMKRLLDGQFEHSGLTLSELYLVEASLCKSLIALYHARIRYPEDSFRAQGA
jgi:putative nucleotidyltransferase with HDIG domain